MQSARDAYRAADRAAQCCAHARLFRLGRRHALIEFFGRRARREQREIVLSDAERAQTFDRRLCGPTRAKDASHSFHARVFRAVAPSRADRRRSPRPAPVSAR